MKIGIDGNSLNIPFYCGSKNYAKNLIEGLSNLDKTNDYLIFSSKKIGIPLQSNFKLIEIPSSIPILKRQLILSYYVKKEKVDIFHYLDPYGSVFLRHPKIVTTIHDLDLDSIYPTFKNIIYFSKRYYCEFVRKFVLLNSKCFITNSNFTHAQLRLYLKKIGKKSKIFTTYLSHDSCFKKVLLSYKKSSYSKYFLAMADFSPRKNIFNVIKAYSLLPSYLNNIYKLILVVSTNEVAEEMHEVLKQHVPEKNIEIICNISKTKLISLYNNATAFLYPSFYEGFGIPILEAMACGCPVICSKGGATEETSGGAAKLVNPRSVYEISQAMIKIIKNRSYTERLIKKGLKRVEDFSWEKTARKTLSVYEYTYQKKLDSR